MVILVTAEEKTLKMKGEECVIHLGHPLGHAVVICILRFKSERVKAAHNGAKKRLVLPSNSHVCPYFPQGGISIGDQPKAKVIILDGDLRGSKAGANQIIIQKRRAQRE